MPSSYTTLYESIGFLLFEKIAFSDQGKPCLGSTRIPLLTDILLANDGLRHDLINKIKKKSHCRAAAQNDQV